ncbi:MAG: tRNA (adenosine(37)-N6)-dimethylallyltransferase MiaA [Planctomycetota bacterium]
MSKLVFIIGCTGSGKGGLGREIASRVGGEIISIDSMKVYRRMDVGTAKPSAEIRSAVPHHMIDVAEPSEEYSVAQFVDGAERVIAGLKTQGKPILVVGGTALYIKALSEGLFEGPGADVELRRKLIREAENLGQARLHERLRQVDPVAAERIHPNDLRRLVRALEVFELTGRPISELQEQWDRDRTRHDCMFIAVRRELDDQNHRTNLRVRRMLESGLVDEVRQLLAEPLPLSDTARKAVGYAEIIRHLRGEISLADATELIKINTRQLAKSQRTWFKRFRQAEWIDVSPEDTPAGVADEIFQRRILPWSP